MTDQEVAFDEQSEDDDNEGDFAEYSPKSEFSKPTIVQTAMQKCLDLRAVELKEGYYNYKADNSGNVMKTWIPDSRKVYCSSIKALGFLLSPEIGKSKETRKKIEEIEKEYDDIFKKYSYTELRQDVVDQRVVYIPTDTKYIPEYDAVVMLKNARNPLMALKSRGGWNHLVTAYWNELVELSDQLFAVLNELIDNLNYFKSKANY